MRGIPMNENKQEIISKRVPLPGAPYSQGVVSQGRKTIYVSGQLPIDLKTGEFIKGGVTELTNQIIDYIEAILVEAGASLDHVVRVDIFLTDMRDFGAMNAVYEKRFSKKPFPARQTVQVAGLPKGSIIEMSCIAQFD